jgi:hypothetical protein
MARLKKPESSTVADVSPSRGEDSATLPVRDA